MNYNIPILIICFKRYEKTLELFNRIKSINPSKVYVAIDGARNEEEKLKVDKVASIFQDSDCNFEINIRRSETNQGCKYGIYNAINWFFEHEEYGIILEDDILPYPQFFPYCEELLKKYKDDKRIACISGWSYFYNKKIENYDCTYYFSHIQSSWGWATWKDRWEMIDLELKNTKFEDIERNFIRDNVSEEIINYYRWIYDKRVCFDSAWDYQFCLSVLMKNNMYCIQPLKAFVRNVGADGDATHTSGVDFNKSEVIEDNFVMKHPESFFYNPVFDTIRNMNTNEYIPSNKKRTKILFDGQIYDLQKFGGISRMYAEIANELNGSNDYYARFSIGNTENKYLKDIYCDKDAESNFNVSVNELKKGDFDVFYPTFFSPYFLDHIGNKPFVMSVHDMIPEIYEEFFNKNDLQIVGKRNLVQRAAAIEVPTECTKKDLIKILGVDESKIRVIGRALSPNFGEKFYSESVVDYEYILYVGQRNAYKRFDWFVKHISKFLKKHKDVHLICTGNEFSEKEKELLKKYGIKSRAHTIFADDITMATLYKYAKFFVFSSEYEGFGLPVLESYKMGCIALLNDTEVFREVTDNLGTFFEMSEKKSNLSEVAEKVYSLSDEERNNILNKQYTILEKHSFEKYINNVKSMLNEVVGENKTNKKKGKVNILICTHKPFNPIVSNDRYKIINCNAINNDTWNGLKGSFYSEIMSYFYIYENYELSEYIGFCHYRKYFSFKDDIPDMDEIFSEYDVIAASPLILKGTIKEQYITCHNIEDLYIVGGILAEKYPEYVRVWGQFINGNVLFPYNMFIMKKEDFAKYIAFVRNVLDEYVKIVGTDIYKRIGNNIEKYLKSFKPNDSIDYQYRIGGYLAERLTSLYLMSNFKNIKAYEVIITEEKYK